MWISDLAGRLARTLPLGSAQRLGRLGGQASFHFLRRRRRQADANLRHAFPELGSARRDALARAAFAELGAAACVAAAAERLGPVSFCRHLTLDGWSHLDDAGASGCLMMGARMGLWRHPMVAVALYRGPLAPAGELCRDPGLGRWAAGLESRLGRRLLEEHGTSAASEVLRGGGRVGFLLGEQPSAGDGVEVLFLGRQVRASTFWARLSLDSGAPVVPVFGVPGPRGACRVEVGTPLSPQGHDAGTLTRSYAECVERQVRRRPQLWPWWRDRLGP